MYQYSTLDDSPPSTPRFPTYSSSGTTGRPNAISVQNTRGGRRFSKCAYFSLGSIFTIALGAIGIAFVLLDFSSDSGGDRPGPYQPGGMVDLRVGHAGPSSLTLVWNEPPTSTSHGSVCSSYELQYKRHFASTWKNKSLDDKGLGLRATIGNLNASTEYCFRIRGRNDFGIVWKWSSSTCNYTTTVAVPGPPEPPIAVDFKSAPRDSVETPSLDVLHVKVPLPEESGGQAVKMMSILVHGKVVKNITKMSSSGIDTHVSFDLGTRGSLLDVASRACNDMGCGPASPPTNCIITQSKPAVALCSPCAVGNSGGTEPGSNLPPPSKLVASPAPDSLSLMISWSWKATLCNAAKDRPGFFQIQRSDWWQQLDISKGEIRNITVPPAASGRDIPQSASIANVLPSAPYNVRIRALSAANSADVPSKWTYLSFRLPENGGACANFQDLTIQRDNFGTMVSTIQTCMLSCIISGDPACVSSCVMKKLEFSTECASCWAAEAKCTLSHCSGQCIKNPKGAACLACTDKWCMPDLETCTGLPRYTFPNPK